jgi:hypothetical protein
MTELKLSNGEITTDQKLIMNKITNFYTKLYKNDEGFEKEQPQSLTKIMEQIYEVVTEEKLTKLTQTPSMVELEQVVQLLTSNKAPGSDGLTIEAIRHCWELISSDLLNLILQFWETETLYAELLQGIIWLLPKKFEKIDVNDWRPLTLLQIVFKIIA